MSAKYFWDTKIFLVFRLCSYFTYLLLLVASNDLDVLPRLYPSTTAPQPVSHVSCIHVSLHHFIKHTSCRVHVTACRESLLRINYSAAITSARHSHTLSLQIFFPSLQIFLPSHSADIYISALQVRAFEWLKLKLIFRK